MSVNEIFRTVRSLASRVKGGIVQDCPPELNACEVCGSMDCTNQMWLTCSHRLAAAQFMKSGDRQALAELEQLRKARGSGLGCEFSSPEGTP